MKGKYLIAIVFLASWTVITASQLPFFFEAEDECPTPDDCPPKLIEDKDDCTKYYECLNGQKKPRSCKEGLYFSKKWRGCVERNISDCPVLPEGCEKEGDLLPHECHCYEFYQCKNGGKTLQQCKSNYIFNPNSRTCEPGDPVTCKLYPGEGCREGEFIPHECDCIHYYECKNGRKALRECNEGENFNNVTLTCVKGYNCTDRPFKCFEGNTTKFQCNCEKYYECKDNDWYEAQCPNGTHYSVITRTCISPMLAGCKSPGECKDSSNNKWRHECDCRLYYQCVNGTKIIYPCEWDQYFNNVTGTCENLSADINCKNKWDPWGNVYYF